MFARLLGSIGANLLGDNQFLRMAGRMAGSALGSAIDNHFEEPFKTTYKDSFARRVHELKNTGINDDRVIPYVAGKAKLAGNIIWSSSLREQSQTHTKTINTKISQTIYSHHEYRYYVDFAVAICKGVVDEITAVYFDDVIANINIFQHRIYKGTSDQMPDHLIKDIAFRDIAYIVFENFPLSDFSNRIPNITFEVRMKTNTDSLEKQITGVALIPGSGEFAYATTIVKKYSCIKYDDIYFDVGSGVPLNMHMQSSKSNFVIAVDNLKKTLPNNKWVAPVVGWFINNINLNEEYVFAPGVEFKGNEMSTSMKWEVAGINRKEAYLVGNDNGNLRYGGTPCDESVIEMLNHLQTCDYKIMLYPMFFVDMPKKPWRGRVFGDAKSVVDFIEGAYSNFIVHYANLAKGKIDAFVIGSEMVAITKVVSNNQYVAVEALARLAQKVKEILGDKVAVTYAADWSEYHHDDNGYYHLDELWASPAIDFIGIDAYFPLSSENSSVYDVNDIKEGMTSGEGYDFYYLDYKGGGKLPLSPQYAWKNIRWWWENEHYNPDGIKTPWVPKSKKIWFTEFGFPSVDAASNEPNVFFAPGSSESKFPHLSKGQVDYKAQRIAIEGLLNYVKENSDMIEQAMLWCWDARPYPIWPDRADIWSDSESYSKGHWVQGKLGNGSLKELIDNLLKLSGLRDDEYTIANVHEQIEGLVINYEVNARKILEQLVEFYDLKIIEKSGLIIVSHQQNPSSLIINDDFLLSAPKYYKIQPCQSSSLVYVIDNITFEYQLYAHKIEQENNPQIEQVAHLPIVMGMTEARYLQHRSFWQKYNQASKIQYSSLKDALCVGDCITVQGQQFILESKVLEEEIQHCEASLYQQWQPTIHDTGSSSLSYNTQVYDVWHFYIPLLENALFIAVANAISEFKGALVESYKGENLGIITKESLSFTLLNSITIDLPYCFSGSVMLYCGHQSPPETGCLLIDEELIYYSGYAHIAIDIIKLNNVVRGVYGSKVSHHKQGARVLEINEAISINNNVISANEQIRLRDPFGYNFVTYISLKSKEELDSVLVFRLSANKYLLARQSSYYLGLDYKVSQPVLFKVSTANKSYFVEQNLIIEEQPIVSVQWIK